MSFNRHELMDFKKFAQSKRLLYNNKKIYLHGAFKAGKRIVNGDIFWANEVHISGKPVDIELVYKTYLEWFNYTRNDNEPERAFVSVKLGEAGE